MLLYIKLNYQEYHQHVDNQLVHRLQLHTIDVVLELKLWKTSDDWILSDPTPGMRDIDHPTFHCVDIRLC